MTPVERSYLLYLEDMLNSMMKIKEYIKDLDFNEFKKNSLVSDAVIRNFEVLGESSKNIPIEVKAKYPDVPWNKMYGLRNLISHAYFGIDYEILWEISKNHLPANLLDIEEIIKKEKGNEK